MHIVIDARMIGPKNHGISRHTLGLINHLEKIDTRHQFTLLVNTDYLKDKTGFSLQKMDAPWISLKEQIELPRMLKTLKPDLFHTPSFIAPFFCPVPLVITLHDIIHVAYKPDFKLKYWAYYQTILKRALHSAKRVITVSDYSRKDISRLFNIPKSNIDVIYNGLDAHFSPIDDKNVLKKVQKKYQLPDSFLLYVGNMKKHKNALGALNIYEKTATPLPLVMVGVKSLPAADNQKVFFIEHVDNEDLPAIYNLCRLFIYPSYYEGFGFPPLEALACGKHVVTSNTTSLPEILNRSTKQLDPYNVDAFALDISKALANPRTTTRNEYGISQAKKFNWRTAAEKTLEVYESCTYS